MPRTAEGFYTKEENVALDLPMTYEPELGEGIGASRQECAKFTRRLLKVEICESGRSKVNDKNNIFFLRKANGEPRLIIAAFKANVYPVKPEYIHL